MTACFKNSNIFINQITNRPKPYLKKKHYRGVYTTFYAVETASGSHLPQRSFLNSTKQNQEVQVEGIYDVFFTRLAKYQLNKKSSLRSYLSPVKLVNRSFQKHLVKKANHATSRKK